jgi:leucyl aminopeptidase
MTSTGTTRPGSAITPSFEWCTDVPITVSTDAPAASAVGAFVATGAAAPDELGASAEGLAAAGFTGASGTTCAIPHGDGVRVAVGLGDATAVDATSVRLAAAAFARATRTHGTIGLALSDVGLPADELAQAVVEGILLARYSFTPMRNRRPPTPLDGVVLGAGDLDPDALEAGIGRGRLHARATLLARDLANCPHNYLSASDMADIASGLAGGALSVEVFDKDALLELGCGGLLGVNAGSAEPPRMIKLTYTPAGEPTARLALVGKGIMYDSGGIALKPGDVSHSQMKNDMSGAAAVLASMTALGELGCTAAVTGYLMCTDNMPSGTATALGDVVTMRGGTTVEVVNTDAEGRLVMADALVLAAEAGHDAIVDIATLTGACLRALGTKVAGVMGNDQGVVDRIRAAADATGESVWQLPLEQRYRSELDTPVADLKNLGGANAGAITAALFLNEFVAGIPWAHIDIAGTAQSDGDGGWDTDGCTGFGARLLISLALGFAA